MDKSRPIHLTSGVQSFETVLEGKKFLYSKQEKKLKKKARKKPPKALECGVQI